MIDYSIYEDVNILISKQSRYTEKVKQYDYALDLLVEKEQQLQKMVSDWHKEREEIMNNREVFQDAINDIDSELKTRKNQKK